MNIGIIGCGNMGGALLAAFQQQSTHSITAFDPNKDKVLSYGDGLYRDLASLITESDIILLAVKPQSFLDLAGQIGDSAKNKIIISIMAGVSITSIQESLGTTKVVRCMPNMPVKLNAGVLGWYADNLNSDEKVVINDLFSLAGESIELSSESLVNQITLISGCGPAYYALFTEILESEAIRLGFNSDTAQRIASGTLQGSAKVLQSTTPTELRIGVTSKGGVTEAILNNLAENNFAKVFSNAIDAGTNRINELGKK